MIAPAAWWHLALVEEPAPIGVRAVDLKRLNLRRIGKLVKYLDQLPLTNGYT
jgi:hypothetical protein